MRELHVPSTITTITTTNTADFVFDNAVSHPAHVALRRVVDGAWHDVRSDEFAAVVSEVAKGLIAAGIAAGDRVAVMSKTRYEWTVTDFAVLAIGAVVVPVYETSSAEQVAWILSDSGARAVFAETVEHRATVAEVRAELPELEHVWGFDDDALDTVRAGGAAISTDSLDQRRRAVGLEDLASLIYTSGTTGRPKGCELTHRSFVVESLELVDLLDEFINRSTSTLLFLPIAHVFGRVIQMGAIAAGCTLGHTADVRNLLDDLDGFRPSFVLAVPRVFEKVYNGAKQKAHAEHKGAIFDRADAVAVAYSRAIERGKVPFRLRLAHRVFDALVYSKLRAALGGNCVAAVSGGAPLGERLGHFFRGVGVVVYEGYGLTETCAGVTVNRPQAIRIGTVGRPVGGTGVQVAPDGELLFTAPHLFRGYWHDDEATAQTIDADGWLHTGDIGDLDEDGFVRITGRKKELIVTAAGKNVAPAQLEDRVRAHWLVDQCLVVGDQRPYVAALVTLDPEALPRYLEKAGLPADTALARLTQDADLRAEIQGAIDDANRSVSRAESIRRFAILAHEWTEADGQLTPSLKIRRSVVHEENTTEIDSLYGAEQTH